MAESGGWRRLTAGVRFRTALAATVVVGVVLAAGVTVLAVQQRSSLRSSITSSAETRAEDLAVLVEAGAIEDPLPSSTGALFAQIVGPEGTVVASSAGLGGLAPFTTQRPAAGETARDTVNELLEPVEDDAGFIEDESPYRVIVRGVATTEGTSWVMVAISLEPAEKAAGVLRPLLLAGLPVVLVLVGGVVWGLTGLALRPVEAMRREAEAISAAEFDRRLPVPDSQDEVHRLAVTLNAMLERLAAASAQQHRFIADASHELKSPVAAIRTMLEVAQGDPDFGEWNKLTSDLLREDLRLEQLVGDLLTLARSDEGAPSARRTELDLDQIVGREIDNAARRFDVRFEASAVEPMRMWGDPDGLARLFRNLLDNAGRHARSVVQVAAVTRGADNVITVSDDGPGIPEADRTRVFERFVRLDAARSRAVGGSGLGLALALAVAHHHDGDITVERSPSGGAAFEVSLPSSS